MGGSLRSSPLQTQSTKARRIQGRIWSEVPPIAQWGQSHVARNKCDYFPLSLHFGSYFHGNVWATLVLLGKMLVRTCHFLAVGLLSGLCGEARATLSILSIPQGCYDGVGRNWDCICCGVCKLSRSSVRSLVCLQSFHGPESRLCNGGSRLFSALVF